MALALSSALRLQPDPVRRFLAAAVVCDAPAPATLAAVGVPRYEADLWCRRLEAAGELAAGTWVAEARDGYRALLVESGDRPARRLDRLHDDDRPREKALHSGIKSLSDAELLALLLRTGVGDEGVMEFADRLLADHDGLLGLARSDLDALLDARGLGPAKATEIAAAFELAARIATATRRRERPLLRTPEEVVAFIAADAALLGHEQFWCLPLDARSCLIGEPRVVSKGDVDGTDAGPRAFFRLALAAGASRCVAVHNHPTGDPAPSAADRAVTMRLHQAGRILDVMLVDHIVLGDGGRFASIRRDCPECFR
jgi:DNA repair protein RadC